MARTRAHRRATRRTTTAGLAAVAGVLALTACSVTGSGSGSDAASGSGTDGSGGTVTLVTHDSFHLSDGLLEQFEADTGLTVKQVAPGDGGALVNQLILTKDAPLGDVVYGIDNTFASRAMDEGVL
jgi:thiamine transport system substrate-binding protein